VRNSSQGLSLLIDLARIERSYDPTNVFRVNQNISPEPDTA
jgi:hypothetical protein